MKLAGHKQTYLYEIDGHGHGGNVVQIVKIGKIKNKKQVAENQPLVQNTTPWFVGMRRLERPTPTSRT